MRGRLGYHPNDHRESEGKVWERGADVQRAYGQCTDDSECNGGICIKSSHELSRSNFVGSCARVLSQFSAALPSFNPEKGTAGALELDVNTRT